jgi:hypothetical protein
MATVKQKLDIESAVFRTTSFPQRKQVNGTNIPVVGLYYDASSDEAAFFRIKAHNYGSGNITLNLNWYAATASSGNVVWEAQVAAITPNTDTQDIETDSLATLNYVQDTHLGTTNKREHTCAITISNLDSLSADDDLVIRIARDANGTSATDDMTGDAILTSADISYSDS